MKVLITNYFGLGNFIQTIPLIIELKKKYSITLLDSTNKYMFDDILSVNHLCNKDILFTNEINQYDTIIFPSCSTPPWSIFLYILFNYKKKIIITDTSYGRGRQKIIIKSLLLCRKILLRKNIIINQNEKHNIKINDLILESIFNKTFQTINYPDTDNYHLNSKFNIDHYGKYICIQLFSGIGFSSPKNWNFEKMFELIKLLVKNNFNIVLLGDQDHNGYVKNKLINKKFSKNIINLIGKTNIQDLIKIMKKSQLILCLESGIMHLADMLGLKKTIVLFGPTKTQLIAPLSKDFRIIHLYNKNSPRIERNMDERDLIYNFPNLHKYSNNVSVEEIYLSIINKLKEK